MQPRPRTTLLSLFLLLLLSCTFATAWGDDDYEQNLLHAATSTQVWLETEMARATDEAAATEIAEEESAAAAEDTPTPPPEGDLAAFCAIYSEFVADIQACLVRNHQFFLFCRYLEKAPVGGSAHAAGSTLAAKRAAGKLRTNTRELREATPREC